MVDIETESLVGYFTLAAASIPFDLVPEVERKRARLSRYPELSAVLLARLARDIDWRGKGIGELLLIEALRMTSAAADSVGVAFLIVDAIDQQAAEFYLDFGFQSFDDSNRKLFMAMATMKEIIKP